MKLLEQFKQVTQLYPSLINVGWLLFLYLVMRKTKEADTRTIETLEFVMVAIVSNSKS